LSLLTPPSELRLLVVRFHYRQKISVAILAFINVVVEVNKGLTIGFRLTLDFGLILNQRVSHLAFKKKSDFMMKAGT